MRCLALLSVGITMVARWSIPGHRQISQRTVITNLKEIQVVFSREEVQGTPKQHQAEILNAKQSK